jgi:hypothetical protein
MTVRSNKWVLVVKCSWLAVNLTAWLMGLGSCVTEPNCWLAKNTLLPISFLLSFPGSILFLIFNEVLIEMGVFIDAPTPMYFTYLSLGALIVGYIQWFHLIPAIFGQQEVTVLSLNQPITTSAKKHEIQPKPRKPAQLKALQILPFDHAGRTPLERAINRRKRRQLTDSS